MFLGELTLGEYLTFPAMSHTPGTAELTDADAVPEYRIYEDETGAAIATGSMAKLDDDNTTGFYSERILVDTANGYASNKSYTVYITAAVGTMTGGEIHTFRTA